MCDTAERCEHLAMCGRAATRHANALIPLQQVRSVPNVRHFGGERVKFLKCGCHALRLISVDPLCQTSAASIVARPLVVLFLMSCGGGTKQRLQRWWGWRSYVLWDVG